MKKYLKYIGIIISLIVVIGIMFFVIDFNRVKNEQNPIFCIRTRIYEDGGTREFLGLGYKVIDFHTINGFSETKIGSYFMKYEDFDDEISKCDDIVIDEIVKSEEYRKQVENTIIIFDLPKEWNFEEIDNPENQNAKFELKLYKDSKEKTASLYYYNEMFGVCGTGLVSKKITLNNSNEASVGFYDGNQIWNFIAFGNLNRNIAVLNNGLDENDANELLGIIKTIRIENDYNLTDFYNQIKSSGYPIELKVDENSITSKGAKFIITNTFDEEYHYGANYRIDKKINNEWKEVETKYPLAWNEIAYILRANSSNEINIDWSIGYGELETGEYRVAKKVFKTTDAKDNREIYAEFEIK